MPSHRCMLIVAALLALGVSATGQLRVVTTQPDLADLAATIGGKHVSVSSLTKGTEDLHLVRPRPSLLVKLRRADAFFELGLDAEHAWVPPLLRAARNDKIKPGAPGFVNCSSGIRAKRVPTATTRGAGVDLHPRGNPHYNLDPRNMITVAVTIRDALKRMLPDAAADIHRNHAAWEKRCKKRLAVWKARLAPFARRGFIEGHDAWIYFAEAFDLAIVARLEPKPGASPSPAHMARVIKKGREKKVRLVLARPKYADVAEKVAGAIEGKAVVLPLSSTTRGSTKGYIEFMDHVVETFVSRLEE